MMRFAWSALISLALSCAAPDPSPPGLRAVLVTIDGLRWQEVFRGADTSLMTVEGGGVDDAGPLREAFWRDDPGDRRQALMPFLWNVVAREGMIVGDRDRGSTVRVTNGMHFSYPGYNEMLTGYPDDARIDSNDKVNNPNVTVLEWLGHRPGLTGRVAAFGSWDVFPWIINEARSGVFVDAGWEPYRGDTLSERLQLLGQLARSLPREWEDIRYDALTVATALEHVRLTHPRILYLALDEPDSRAHERRYDRYLGATHRIDGLLQHLWTTLQGLPDYRDRTTLILTADHGRGSTPADWTDHGRRVPGSEFGWLAVLGPGTPSAGSDDRGAVTLGQVAATLAAAIGEDYRDAVPDAQPSLIAVAPSTPPEGKR